MPLRFTIQCCILHRFTYLHINCVVVGGLEGTNPISFILYRKKSLIYEFFSHVSSVAERIKLVCRGTTVLVFSCTIENKPLIDGS